MNFAAIPQNNLAVAEKRKQSAKRLLFLYQTSTPRINTGISIFDTPLISKSQANYSKYETPVLISSANTFTGTISIPASIMSRFLKMVIFAHTL
jgi:hypothetical protein